MNRLVELLIILLPSTLVAAEQSRITTQVLDERVVYRIPVAQDRVTTIRFPAPIRAIDGAGVTLDGKTPAFFHLGYRPTNVFFSVRALTRGGSANLNVACHRGVYVLELFESPDPVLSVLFQEPPKPIRSGSRLPLAEAPHLSVARLLGLLQKAKAYRVLKERYPQAVNGTRQVRPNLTNEYERFLIQIDEVTRFDAEDALVFHLRLSSRTGQEVRYKPETFAVRVGEFIYPQAITDADGIIPAQGCAHAYFAIVGSPSGQRAELSPQNDFVVLVTPQPSPSSP